MLDGRQPAGNNRIAVVTADSGFERSVRSAFVSHGRLVVDVIGATLAGGEGPLNIGDVRAVVIDLVDVQAEMVALAELASQLAGSAPIIVVGQVFSESVARRLLQLRIADFLIKPINDGELIRACEQAVADAAPKGPAEAQICTFLPAAGGVGLTTLAIQTAMLLLRQARRERPSICLVDLDFQNGACADYLDLEPRLDVGEIEPRPERLDRHLLEVMLSHHPCGLAVIAAPNRPAEMRSFDPDVVTRLLDLVSSHFEYVVIDMPRTWFPWTDNVLFGSNQLFIVAEMTVPGLRHAKQLIAAIGERLAGGPVPRVIVNRFEQQLFGPGLKRADLVQALGEAFAGVVPNNYRLVREAVDRGVPLDEVKSNNNVTSALRKIIFSPPATASAGTDSRTSSTKQRSFWSK